MVMSERSSSNLLVPEVEVKINKARLPDDLRYDLVSVTIQEDLFSPGMFSLRLTNVFNLDTLRSDDDRLNIGQQVEIQMGYVDNLRPLIYGDITGLELEYSAEEVPMLTVRGYDHRHRLMRGQKYRSFVNKKDSEIAAQIAQENHLEAQTVDTEVTLDFVLQPNQTDLAFLQERAWRIGYEVVVDKTIDKTTLLFRPYRNAEEAAITLNPDVDLLEFHPRLGSLSQVDQIEVRGWSPQNKTGIVAQANAQESLKDTTKMGGHTSGPQVAHIFGPTAGLIVDVPVFNQAEASQIARGQLTAMALAYISGDGLAIGRTDLRAGSVIKVEGMGQRFSGKYYITGTTHTFSPKRGYRTAFTFRRNAT